MPTFTPYFSEIRYLGGASTDFIEVALDNGVDPATIEVVVYNGGGTIRSTNTLPGSPDNTIAGTDVYSINTGVHKLGAIALVSNGVVVSFVSFGHTVTATEGPASGSTSTMIGTTHRGESLESTDMGASYQVQGSPNRGTIPCFLSGTLISTPDGPRPVETLRAGDLVKTHDNGPQPIIWVGARAVGHAQTRTHDLHPILIPAGALGEGKPTRDVLVSPAHRVLVRSPSLQLLFATSELLLAAKHLVGRNGIRIATECTQPVYYHLLFANHQLVKTSGMISESFHPMAVGMSGLDIAARDELFTLWPMLRYRADLYGPTARQCARGHEAPLVRSALSIAA